MNLKAAHYIILALSAIVACCAFISQQFPADASIANAVAGICTQLMAVLGILSPGAGQASGSAPSPVPGSVAASVAQQTAAGQAALQASAAPGLIGFTPSAAPAAPVKS